MAKKKVLKGSNDSSREKRIHLPLGAGTSILDPRVQTVIDFMNANLHRRIRSTQLAEVAVLSSSRLSHLFKGETGLSPGEYLIRLRMEKARHLLETTRLSVKQIMVMSGYGHKGLFAEHFNRYFHLAPSEYRRPAP